MHILLTNDDGILAPGLVAMYRELAKNARVTVAAPTSAQSAMGHAITVGHAIEVRKIHVNNEFHGWSIDGRPADCVKLAIGELLDEAPDLVVSGINDGANVGINVLYSGTVAAAAEGALLGYPAVAVSLKRGQEPDFARAARIALTLIENLLEQFPFSWGEPRTSVRADLQASEPVRPSNDRSTKLDSAISHDLSPGKLVNINIPDLQPGLPHGVRVAAQALQMGQDDYTRRDLPDGVRQYGLYGDYNEPEGQYDTDLHAVQNGYVAITPLHADLTDHNRLPTLNAIKWTNLP